MQPIRNLVSMDAFKNLKVDNQPSDSLDNATIRVVNLLFRELQDIFPAFKQAWPTQEDFDRAKKSWIKAFLAAGINEIEQLRFGLRKCRLSEIPFAPTSGQFITWCTPTPDDLGIPSFEKAYTEACKNSHPSVSPKNWSHEAVEHAAMETGSFNLSNLSRAKSKPLFDHNYAITIRMLMKGENLKPIEKAIENKTNQIVLEKMSRQEAMSQIKDMLK